MEQSHEELSDLMARRLLQQAEEISGEKKTDDPTKRGESIDDHKALQAVLTVAENSDVATANSLLPATFTKVEKSLASLGFFTPSSKRIKDKKVKRIGFTREIDGKRVDVTAEIVPSALFGLPVTADQDKYLALQKIITNELQTNGKIENPIRFRSADLLHLLGRSDAGKNYSEISEWLAVMMSTTIFSQGVVYKAGEKKFAKDIFHVFDRVVNIGKELPDGTIADANYIWLSDWQLQNINHNFLLPIDLDTYRELKNHIAKALVPLLQIWLFASQRSGSFEKRYDELCEILTLRQYPAQSQIVRQLRPSLDELTSYEYLEKWRIEKTSDRKAYKIIFFHGPKFHRDRRRRLEQKKQSQPTVVVAESQPIEPDLPEPGKTRPENPSTDSATTAAKMSEGQKASIEPTATRMAGQTDDPSLTSNLVSRGVMESKAAELLRSIPMERLQAVGDYIDYFDSIRPDPERGKGPGLLIYLIEKGDPLPPSFQTRRQREEQRVRRERQQKQNALKEALTEAYEQHRQAAIDRFIAEIVTAGEFERRVAACRQAMLAQTNLDFPSVWNHPDTIERQAKAAARAEIGEQVSVMTFENFRKAEIPRLLAELKLDPAELGINLATDPANQVGQTVVSA